MLFCRIQEVDNLSLIPRYVGGCSVISDVEELCFPGHDAGSQSKQTTRQETDGPIECEYFSHSNTNLLARSIKLRTVTVYQHHILS